MKTLRRIILLGLAALLAPAIVTAQNAPHAVTGATSPPPLFTDRGSYHFAVTTKSPEAQRYFDQGMRLMWGYNLEEAQRSFERAEQLDSTCAMCAWGTALSLGPHYNLPATPERTVAANTAAQRALRRAGNASAREKALIEVLSKRYADPAPTKPEDQAKLDEGYQQGMHDLMARFPNDPDIELLWAESQMDLHPWDLYTWDHKPKPWTPEIVATIEKALAKAPDHIGAIHLYIHTVEASSQPERALPAAKRLAALAPGEPHLVHMPAHIYHRVGMFDKSMESNRHAVVADDRYRKTMNPQGFYLMYAAHNHQFLMWSCWMAGRFEEALRESRAMLDIMPLDMLRAMPGFDFTAVYPAWTLVRFGRWQDVLNESPPPPDFAYARGAWHVARSIAQASLGKLSEAGADRDSANAFAKALPDEAVEGFNSAKTLLSIGTDMATGMIEARRGNTDDAVQALTRAAATEDQLRYDEPSDWYLPARHLLGQVLLDAGRAGEAQKVYETDLDRNPGNGWAYIGLWKSLKAQKKGSQATTAEAKALKAFKDADTKLEKSWLAATR